MDINWKKLLLGLSISFATVLLFFGGLEGYLRIFTETTGHIYCKGPTDRSEFHSQYGWIEHPNSQYLEKKSNKDNWSLHTYNDEGFRDTYNSGEENVIVLGDSFTRGSLVDDHSTYTHLLDRWTPHTTFRNYGTGGYGTAQELLVYQDYSKKFDHNLVILGYYFNDPGDNVDKNPRRPTFELTSDRLILKHRLKEKEVEGEGIIKNPFLQKIQDFLAAKT